MLIEQIWTDNVWRNFNYLVACPVTGEALAIDPSEAQQCMAVAEQRNWQIKQMFNTHDHYDHIAGNQVMAEATGASLLAHSDAMHTINGVDSGLKAGAVVKVGSSVALEVLDTPGHTMSHLCLLSKSETPVLFSGDTLFNAGAGNCHGGGNPIQLYHTFATQLMGLADDTLIYPGHDYTVSNLKFTLSLEPGNTRASSLLQQAEAQSADQALVTSIGLEKQVNCFFRLDNLQVIASLRKILPDFPSDPDPKTVFVALRELRNSW